MQRMLKKNKSVLLVLAMLLLGSILFSGCGQKEDDTGNTANNDENTELTGSITIAGSTSVQPFSEVLAEEFMAKNPGTQISVQGGGSSQGVAAAVSGAADIGAASRDLKDEEKAETPELQAIKIAIDGVAIVVNPANGVSDITMDDLKNVFTGNITNWKQLGGIDAPITVVSREAGSGTRDAFESIIMDDEPITASAIIQNSNGAVRTTVAGDKNAIGFVSLAVVNEEIKALSVDGVEASIDNIKSGNYKVFRNFNYLVKSEPTGLTKAFIDYVLGEEGQAIIEEEGAITVQ